MSLNLQLVNQDNKRTLDENLNILHCHSTSSPLPAEKAAMHKFGIRLNRSVSNACLFDQREVSTLLVVVFSHCITKAKATVAFLQYMMLKS